MIDQVSRLAKQPTGVEPEVQAAMLEAIGNTTAWTSCPRRSPISRTAPTSIGCARDGPPGRCGEPVQSRLPLPRPRRDRLRESFDAALSIWIDEGDAAIGERAAALLGLARVAERDRDLELAMERTRDSLALRQREIDSDPMDITELKVTMARLHRRRNELGEAESLYSEALADLEEEGFGTSPMSATILNNLAVVQWQRGAWDDAEPLYRKSLSQRRRFYPEGHSEIGNTLLGLGSVLEKQGNHLDASRTSVRRCRSSRPATVGRSERRQRLGRPGTGALRPGAVRGGPRFVSPRPPTCRRSFGGDHPGTAEQESVSACACSNSRTTMQRRSPRSGLRGARRPVPGVADDPDDASLARLCEERGDQTQAALWSKQIEQAEDSGP